MVTRLNPPLSPLNLDEEYNNALRTKSFIDIYSKLHHNQKQQQQQEEEQKEEGRQLEEQKPSEDLHVDAVLPYYHDQKPAVDSSGSGDFGHLLVDFFDTTRQSTAALSSLLSSVALARSHHRSIRRLLLDLSQCRTSPQAYYAQLSSYLGQDNPLSTGNLTTFHAAHARYPELIRRLNRANRKMDRRLRMRRMIILAVFGECRRRVERVKRRVDGAAKGAYIVGRDMDTVSRMVRRVEDEVEHGREVGRMVVRNIVRRGHGGDEEEWGIVREVVKEIEGGRGERELGLEEQVEELEEHVYLCLITINRSRRMVAQDMHMGEELGT